MSPSGWRNRPSGSQVCPSCYLKVGSRESLGRAVWLRSNLCMPLTHQIADPPCEECQVQFHKSGNVQTWSKGRVYDLAIAACPRASAGDREFGNTPAFTRRESCRLSQRFRPKVVTTAAWSSSNCVAARGSGHERRPRSRLYGLRFADAAADCGLSGRTGKFTFQMPVLPAHPDLQRRSRR